MGHVGGWCLFRGDGTAVKQSRANVQQLIFYYKDTRWSVSVAFVWLDGRF